MTPELRERVQAAIDNFWDTAYRQGFEQRSHDDSEGSSQAAETELQVVIRDLLAEAEQLRGIEKQAHEEGVIAGKRIAWLEYEVERLEEKLEEQKKRAVWNHEGTSRDYLLAMDKIKKRDEQINALTRQRDRLTAGLREISKETECDGEWMPSNAAICARQALADAGMEGEE